MTTAATTTQGPQHPAVALDGEMDAPPGGDKSDDHRRQHGQRHHGHRRGVEQLKDEIEQQVLHVPRKLRGQVDDRHRQLIRRREDRR